MDVRLFGLALVVAAVAAAAVSPVGAGPDAGTDPADPALVSLDTEKDVRLWPWTSKRTDAATRTLAINLVVYEAPDTVERRLRRSESQDWHEANDTDANVSVDAGADEIEFAWTSAHGSTRYSYAEVGDGGQWLRPRYQLHSGEYLGQRRHVRAYATSSRSSWTAIQAHGEYWDWFRLRHTVTDVWGTSRELEDDLVSQGAGSDRVEALDGPRRSIPVLQLSGLLLLGAAFPRLRNRAGGALEAVATPTGPLSRRGLALFAVAAGLPLAVRGLGVGLELLLSGLSPKFVAAPLYLVLVLGLPAAVYRFGDDVPATAAFALAAGGFLVGVGLDYLAVGVVSPRPRFLWLRLFLAVGLGAVAAGNREALWARATLVAGLAVWLVAVAAAATGHV